MENKNITILVLFILVGILGFRAYRSYTDMNLMYAHLLEDHSYIVQLSTFAQTEFPQQVADFNSKVPKK